MKPTDTQKGHNMNEEVSTDVNNEGLEIRWYKEKICATALVEGSELTFILTGNNLRIHELCGACGQDHKDSDTPYWIFVNSNPVCWSCASTHVPFLHAAAQALNSAYYGSDLIKALHKTVRELAEMFQVEDDDDEPVPF